MYSDKKEPPMNKRKSFPAFSRWNFLLIFSFLSAAGFLALCSKSSPLYPMNDLVDVHCYMTLGRGLLHGQIPYRDLYEQKGPILYFLYAVVALLGQRAFWGQYLLEVVTFGLFLYYNAKIFALYRPEGCLRYLSIPVITLVVCTSAFFSHGGSVEQLCLFLFSYGMYSTLRACHQGRLLTDREAAVNGLFAGISFWIKYTMTVFYFGLALFVLIWYLHVRAGSKPLLRTIGGFLLGFSLVTAAVLAYYLCAGALGDLITCYFYNNLFLYPSLPNQSILKTVLNKIDAAVNDAPPFRILRSSAFPIC